MKNKQTKKETKATVKNIVKEAILTDDIINKLYAYDCLYMSHKRCMQENALTRYAVHNLIIDSIVNAVKKDNTVSISIADFETIRDKMFSKTKTFAKSGRHNESVTHRINKFSGLTSDNRFSAILSKDNVVDNRYVIDSATAEKIKKNVVADNQLTAKKLSDILGFDIAKQIIINYCEVKRIKSAKSKTA